MKKLLSITTITGLLLVGYGLALAEESEAPPAEEAVEVAAEVVESPPAEAVVEAPTEEPIAEPEPLLEESGEEDFNEPEEELEPEPEIEIDTEGDDQVDEEEEIVDLVEEELEVVAELVPSTVDDAPPLDDVSVFGNDFNAADLPPQNETHTYLMVADRPYPEGYVVINIILPEYPTLGISEEIQMVYRSESAPPTDEEVEVEPVPVELTREIPEQEIAGKIENRQVPESSESYAQEVTPDFLRIKLPDGREFKILASELVEYENLANRDESLRRLEEFLANAVDFETNFSIEYDWGSREFVNLSSDNG